VTLADVARAAGVHPGTASRALHGQALGQVSSRTTQRVKDAARRLGYVPDQLARGLRASRSFVVGVVIPDLTNPLFPPIVRGTEEALSGKGYTALLADTDNDPGRERQLVGALLARHVDGLIVATARLEHPLLAELSADGLPIVLVNRVTNAAPLPSVASDDAAGIAAAVEHLVGLGHRRIAHVAGPPTLSTGQARLEAYEAAVRRHRVRADPALVVAAAGFTIDAGAEAARRLPRGRKAPTAIVAANDLLAIGCYEVLADQGKKVPDDVSVIGFNDMLLVDKLTPPLTTVHVSQFEIGRQAAELLLTLLADPDRDAATGRRLLPARLVIRGSTGPARPS
jgi:LacI family transcriptional regulator